MERRIALIISYIFHPLFACTYTIAIMFSINSIFNSSITLNGKLLVLGFVFATTFLFPFMLIFILYRRGMITNLQMEVREERTFPYLMTAVFYYSMYYMLRQLQLPTMFSEFVLGSTLLIALALIINFWWKISIHMIAIGGMIGTMIGISLQLNYDMRLLIALLFIVAGLIGFSRLKLESHKQSQVYTGFLMGLLIMLVLFVRF